MEITDVRVKLIQEPNDRLKAVCSITFDGVFVVRDLKVVDGSQGLFVAMPSRKLTAHCARCGSKNHLRARFCNECGGKLPPARVPAEGNGRTKLHRDIAHPITSEFREQIQSQIIEAFHKELELSRQPGYAPKDIDEAEEPAEVTAEPEQELTEYDALIAGLRGRERDRSPGEGDSGPPRSPSRREGGKPQQDSARPYQDTRRPPPEGGRTRDGGHGESRSRPRQERGGPPPREQSGGPRGPERREPAPPRPVAPAPAPPPKPAPPPVVNRPQESDEPFGAGLL